MKFLSFLGIGTSHERSNKPCQDRLLVRQLPQGRTILAVSDGCSGSAFAELAASANLEVIYRLFENTPIAQFSKSSVENAIPGVAEHISDVADDDITGLFQLAFLVTLKDLLREHGSDDFSDVCATLLFCIIEKDRTLIGHIGDGNIILFNKQGEPVFISGEDNGEDSSHTFFTASREFRDHFRLDVIQTSSFDTVSIFSDGLQQMFRCEFFDPADEHPIVSGCYDIVAEPFMNNEITTHAELTDRLADFLGNAFWYGGDDWSLILAKRETVEEKPENERDSDEQPETENSDATEPTEDEGTQESDSDMPVPISLVDLFYSEYYRRHPEENPEGGAEDNPEDNPDDKPEEHTADNPEENTEDNTKNLPEDTQSIENTEKSLDSDKIEGSASSAIYDETSHSENNHNENERIAGVYVSVIPDENGFDSFIEIPDYKFAKQKNTIQTEQIPQSE